MTDSDKKWCVALAVALMNTTYERIGNSKSAENGHVGVTGWTVKHLKIKGDTATLTYVGKSGVSHEKTITENYVVSALKKAIKGKKPNDLICGGVTASDVNEYLKPFGITAKDMRGYHANAEMSSRLKDIRSKGEKLPTDKKEREKLLKEEFKEALEETAAAVGHSPTMLRNSYLVPGFEDQYMKDGTLPKKLNKKSSVDAVVDRWLGL